MNVRRKALILAFTATTAIVAPMPRADFEGRIGWGEAQAMPVAIPFVAAAAAIGAAGATAAGLATLALALTVLSVGVGIVGQILAKNQTSESQNAIRLQGESEYPPFIFRFGEFRTQGQIVFQATGKGGVNTNRYNLYMTILFNAAPSDDAPWRIWINEAVELTIRSDANNDIDDITKGATSSTFPWDDDKNNYPDVIFWRQLGDKTQFPTKFVNEIGNKLPDLATASWKGCTVLHVFCDYGNPGYASNRWWLGRPRFEVQGKWSKLYDPRKDPNLSVYDGEGSHDPDDRDTWEWSANPALVALFLLRHEKVLARKDEQILIDMFAEAADDCDVGFSERSTFEFYDFDPESTGAPPTFSASIASGQFAALTANVDYGLDQYAELPGTVPVLRLKGTYPSLSRASVYIDMIEEGLDPDVGATITLSSVSGAGASGNTYKRLIFYVADAAANGTGDADAADYGMPPDAKNITLLHDEGLSQFGGTVPNPIPGGGLFVQSRYFSMIVEGGPASGSNYAEWADFAFSAAQDAEYRYRCDGAVEVNTRDYGLLDGVLGSMGGYLDTSRGKIGVRAGVWKAPTMTLPNPIGDGVELTDRADPGFDKMVGVFIGRHRDYTLTETAPYTIALAGRRQELELPMVREPGQAARLVAIGSERLRKNRSLRGEWPASTTSLRVGDRVTTDYDWWPDADGTWLVVEERPVFEPIEGGFRHRKQMTLVEDDEATYTWDEDAWDGEIVLEPIDPGGPVQDPPTNLSAVSNDDTARESISGETAAGTLIPRILISFDGADSTPTDYEIQIDDGTGYKTWGYLDSEPILESPDQYEEYIEPVIVGASYNIRVRARGFALSTWAEVTGILVNAPTATLTAPTLVSESYDEPTETRTLVYRAPDAPDVTQLRVYVSDTELGERSLLGSVYLTANETFEVEDSQAFTGFTRWYHAVAVDNYGSEGAELTSDFTATSTEDRAFSTAFNTAYD